MPCPRQWLLLAGAISVGAGCRPALDETETPEADVSPTPTPGPFLGQTTWAGSYWEYDSALVQADTSLFINVDQQDGTEVAGHIYHFWGYLIVDGYEIPTGQGAPLKGTYLYPGLIDMSGSLADVELDVHMELNFEHYAMSLVLDLEDGLYHRNLSLGPFPSYIPFAE